MAECQIIAFPTPAISMQDPSPSEDLRGIWMSLQYLEEEAQRLGKDELAFIIGMAALRASEDCIPHMAAE